MWRNLVWVPKAWASRMHLWIQQMENLSSTPSRLLSKGSDRSSVPVAQTGQKARSLGRKWELMSIRRSFGFNKNYDRSQNGPQTTLRKVKRDRWPVSEATAHNWSLLVHSTRRKEGRHEFIWKSDSSLCDSNTFQTKRLKCNRTRDFGVTL